MNILQFISMLNLHSHFSGEAERGSPFIYSPLNLRSPGGGESKKSDGKAAKAAPTADLVIAKGDLVSFSLAFKSPVSFDVTSKKIDVNN